MARKFQLNLSQYSNMFLIESDLMELKLSGYEPVELNRIILK